MSNWEDERRVVVRADPSAVARRVAKRLVARLAHASSSTSGPIHIALTGGTVGTATLVETGNRVSNAAIAWDRVHVWWSDERFVAADSPDRNDRGAIEALLSRVPIPEQNVHSMASSDSGLSPEEAADAYARELARYAESEGAHPWPSFEVCLLGVGPDAHIASLFPDRPEILVTDRAVVPVYDAPKPPPTRLTVTRPVINSSRRIWLVMAGPEKASALGLALAGASYTSVPAAGAKGRVRTMFFVDEAAAAEVPIELIESA